jgi:acyl-CoA dehydrogenase
MDFELAEEHRMLKDLVFRFVRDELMPLEGKVLAREAKGDGLGLAPDEHRRLDEVSRSLGLWGLDAPEDIGGADLPAVAMVGVNEELGRTVTPYTLPPDSPNLRMLMATVTPEQREAYLAPYVRGETISAIGISEPGAGADPAGMTTKAVRDGDDWVINGRKIWISRAADADFTIVMALTDSEKRARGGITAFLVDKGTPGFNVLRRIPMVGGAVTYEVALEDCRVPAWKLLGSEGSGFAPMQLRLGTRRIEMASWSIGMAQRALDMICEFAPQRVTFGQPLSERQAVQWSGDLDDQVLRHRDGLDGGRPRHADLRGHGHDQGAAAAADGRQASDHAHL